MKNKILKRMISFIMALIMMLGIVPGTAYDVYADNLGTVYMSVSFDDQYADGTESKIVRYPVSLSKVAAIDLDEYGLSDYYVEGREDEPSVLKLLVYVHTIIFGMDWNDTAITGSPGSIYFADQLFGFSANLMYYVNGEYPMDEQLTEEWGTPTGATADRIFLKNGDFVDLASFSAGDAWWYSRSGFRYFIDENDAISHQFYAKAGEAFDVNLSKHYANMWGDCVTNRTPSDYSLVYYSKTPFVDSANSEMTDDNGNVSIVFNEPGTWYIWSYGEEEYEGAGTIVNSPAYAVVTVEGEEGTVPDSNNAPTLTEGYKSGIGEAVVTIGEEYSINLAEVFADADGDALTYYCNDMVLSDAVYKVVPDKAGVNTYVFKAHDGKTDSVTYTISLTVEEPKKTVARLESLLIYQTKSLNTAHFSNVDGKNTNVVFDPEVFEYELPASVTILDTSNKRMSFYAKPESEEYSVKLYYEGAPNGVDIENNEEFSTNVVYAFDDFLKTGKNQFQIVVSSGDETIESTTYYFTVNMTPTLNTTTVKSEYPVYINKKLGGTTTSVDLYVPEFLQEITVNAQPKYDVATVTYNGEDTNVVDISGKDKIEIVVSKDGISKAYTLNLKRLEVKYLTINTVPEDAAVSVTYNFQKNYVETNTVAAIDGKYPLVFEGSKFKYTYTVEKADQGYLPKSDTITSVEGDSLILDISLTKDPGTQPEDVEDVDWKNFRNSDVNMAITGVKTPVDKVALKWNTTLGNSWSNAPSVPIIVDNKIVTMMGSKLYMLDAETGSIIKSADMVAAPNYGYTPLTYANGMIFCPLTEGTIQAFNATTLESLWVYSDPLGGQSLSPIAYSAGRIYTGFWNGESRNANYVCIDVTDYDTENTVEPKSAVWTYTQNGGFYWAGAVVVGDAVIVGSDDGSAEGNFARSSLYSFNKVTGEIISKVDLAADAGDQRSSIAYDTESGNIYFTTKGGYLYSAKVNAEGTVTNLKGVNYNAQSTSTPVVYKGKVYFGIGSGIQVGGSSGSFVVADADTLEKLFEVKMKGYPQASALLSTAYENQGWLYFYLTYNSKPGGISMLKVNTNAKSAADVQLVEIYEAEGFSEYCIASIVCGEDGTLYYKNDSGNLLAVAPATAQSVIKMIDNIGEVTLNSKGVIKVAREAYEALSTVEKLLVTNYQKLVDAEKTYETLVLVDEVEKLIQSIGKVSLKNSISIENARIAYDKLTKEQQKLVKNYSVLVAAEKEYAKLVSDAVFEVVDLINRIGTVDLDSAEDIAAAKLAYSKLPDNLKSLVTNYNDLLQAEAELRRLVEEARTLHEEGRLILSKPELLELKDKFEAVTEKTTYDDALALLKTFHMLIESQQLALGNNDAVKLAQSIVAKDNHTNAATGVKVEGLEWNVRIDVEETKDEESVSNLKNKLEDKELLTLWDISLKDVLTNKKHTLTDTVEIRIPVAHIGDYKGYDYLKVLHYTEDGKVELLNCEVVDGYVVFHATEFSLYGVVGFMNADDDGMISDLPTVINPQGEAGSNSRMAMVWFSVALAGVAALFVLLSMKKRLSNEV